MLRIGKNPNDSVTNESSTEKQENSPYNSLRTQQGTEPKTQAEISSPSRAMTEGESIARELKEGNLSGFVGGGTIVTGEANFKALMRVDGHLSGRITSTGGTLIVGANGKVDANIEVAIAMIQGTVNGDIIASQRLEIGRAGKVSGNIQTPALVIEQGALFEGTCKMVKMNAATATNNNKTKTNGREDQTTDTSSVKPVGADATDKPKDAANASSVAS